MRYMKDSLNMKKEELKLLEVNKPSQLKMEKNKDIPYDLPEIEKMIKDINKTIQTKSKLSMTEEKKLVKRAAELESLKPHLSVAHNQNVQTKNLKKDAYDLKQKMTENYTTVSKYNEEINELQGQLNIL